jgi:hypothetical protein
MSECDIKIFTSEDKPIDLVLPWFKQILGIDVDTGPAAGAASGG